MGAAETNERPEHQTIVTDHVTRRRKGSLRLGGKVEIVSRRRVAAFVSVVVLMAAACSPGSDQPDAASWLEKWDSTVNLLPPLESMAAEPDTDFCRSVLSDLREANEGLLPSPSGRVDELAREWMAVAEAAFFDCPPDGEDIGSFADAYDELDRLEEAIIDTVAG